MSLDANPPPARRLLSADAPPAFFAPALASLDGIAHGFFGREGGVSQGIYASLNAGTGSKDDPDAVIENRTRIAAAFALPRERLVGVHQIHSPSAVRVEAPWPGARPEADALVTTTPNLALSILTADCAPVLFADAQARVIGAAHAGWKGALGGVLEKTVETMIEAGAARERIVAAIGPCIRQGSYEVGPEFEARFVEADPDNARFFKAGDGDKRKFDLPGFCAHRLAALGLNHFEALPLDTCSDAAAFFSNRRSYHENAPDYGRNCSAIMLTA